MLGTLRKAHFTITNQSQTGLPATGLRHFGSCITVDKNHAQLLPINLAE